MTPTSSPTTDPFADLNLPTIPSGPFMEINGSPSKPKEATTDNPFGDLQLPPSPFDEQAMTPPEHDDRLPEDPNYKVEITTTKPDENVMPSAVPPAPEIQHMPEKIQKADNPPLLEPSEPPTPEPQRQMSQNPYDGIPGMPNPLEGGQVQPPNPEQLPHLDAANENVKPQEPLYKETNVNPGLPNSFFGPDSPSDPDPFANLPQKLLEQAAGPKEPRPLEKIPPNPSDNENMGTQPDSHAKPNPADFEAEEALFNK